MKTKMMSLVVVVLMSATTMFAQSKTEKVKVYGNCGMCENRIEKAAKSVKGVSTADWDKETKMLELTYDSLKTDIHKIEMAVAKAGHDTDMHKATDKAYNDLPGCCQYDRPKKEMKMENHQGHKH